MVKECKYGELKHPVRDPKTGEKRVCKKKPRGLKGITFPESEFEQDIIRYIDPYE